MTATAELELAGVTASYGFGTVLSNIDLRVDQGERVAILGINGAGKSTVFKVIMGVLAAASGEVRAFGESLHGMRPHERANSGLALVPEGRRIFGALTVKENLLVAARATHHEVSLTDRLDSVLTHFPVLKERLSSRGGELSGGQQQMLAIGRALVTSPRILLLDEPSLGLAPLVRREVTAAIDSAAVAHQITVILVEQDVTVGLALTDRYYVLRNGRIATGGTSSPDQVDVLREAYLA